jgi:hypothetical protein
VNVISDVISVVSDSAGAREVLISELSVFIIVQGVSVGRRSNNSCPWTGSVDPNPWADQ